MDGEPKDHISSPIRSTDVRTSWNDFEKDRHRFNPPAVFGHNSIVEQLANSGDDVIDDLYKKKLFFDCLSQSYTKDMDRGSSLSPRRTTADLDKIARIEKEKRLLAAGYLITSPDYPLISPPKTMPEEKAAIHERIEFIRLHAKSKHKKFDESYSSFPAILASPVKGHLLLSPSYPTERSDQFAPVDEYYASCKEANILPCATGLLRSSGPCGVYLDGSRLGGPHVESMIKGGLLLHPHLEPTDLSLSNTRLTKDALISLVENVMLEAGGGDHACLLSLNLSGNDLHGVNSTIIAELLMRTADLRVLRLSNCNLGDDDLAIICNAIVKESTSGRLRILDLSNNKISNGLDCLVNLIQVSPCLEVLDLHWNQISCQGLSLLAFHGLASNTNDSQPCSIRNLDLSFNALASPSVVPPFPGASKKQIAAALKSPIVLGGVASASVLSWLLSSEDGGGSSKLPRCPSLIHLDISHNRLSPEAMAMISLALESNHTLIGIHTIGNAAILLPTGAVAPISSLSSPSAPPVAQPISADTATNNNSKAKNEEKAKKKIASTPSPLILSQLPDRTSEANSNTTIIAPVWQQEALLLSKATSPRSVTICSPPRPLLQFDSATQGNKRGVLSPRTPTSNVPNLPPISATNSHHTATRLGTPSVLLQSPVSKKSPSTSPFRRKKILMRSEGGVVETSSAVEACCWMCGGWSEVAFEVIPGITCPTNGVPSISTRVSDASDAETGVFFDWMSAATTSLSSIMSDSILDASNFDVFLMCEVDGWQPIPMVKSTTKIFIPDAKAKDYLNATHMAVIKHTHDENEQPNSLNETKLSDMTSINLLEEKKSHSVTLQTIPLSSTANPIPSYSPGVKQLPLTEQTPKNYLDKSGVSHFGFPPSLTSKNHSSITLPVVEKEVTVFRTCRALPPGGCRFVFQINGVIIPCWTAAIIPSTNLINELGIAHSDLTLPSSGKILFSNSGLNDTDNASPSSSLPNTINKIITDSSSEGILKIQLAACNTTKSLLLTTSSDSSVTGAASSKAGTYVTKSLICAEVPFVNFINVPRRSEDFSLPGPYCIPRILQGASDASRNEMIRYSKFVSAYDENSLIGVSDTLVANQRDGDRDVKEAAISSNRQPWCGTRIAVRSLSSQTAPIAAISCEPFSALDGHIEVVNGGSFRTLWHDLSIKSEKLSIKSFNADWNICASMAGSPISAIITQSSTQVLGVVTDSNFASPSQLLKSVLRCHYPIITWIYRLLSAIENNSQCIDFIDNLRALKQFTVDQINSRTSSSEDSSDSTNNIDILLQIHTKLRTFLSKRRNVEAFSVGLDVLSTFSGACGARDERTLRLGDIDSIFVSTVACSHLLRENAGIKPHIHERHANEIDTENNNSEVIGEDLESDESKLKIIPGNNDISLGKLDEGDESLIEKNTTPPPVVEFPPIVKNTFQLDILSTSDVCPFDSEGLSRAEFLLTLIAIAEVRIPRLIASSKPNNDTSPVENTPSLLTSPNNQQQTVAAPTGASFHALMVRFVSPFLEPAWRQERNFYKLLSSHQVEIVLRLYLPILSHLVAVWGQRAAAIHPKVPGALVDGAPAVNNSKGLSKAQLKAQLNTQINLLNANPPVVKTPRLSLKQFLSLCDAGGIISPSTSDTNIRGREVPIEDPQLTAGDVGLAFIMARNACENETPIKSPTYVETSLTLGVFEFAHSLIRIFSMLNGSIPICGASLLSFGTSQSSSVYQKKNGFSAPSNTQMTKPIGVNDIVSTITESLKNNIDPSEILQKDMQFSCTDEPEEDPVTFALGLDEFLSKFTKMALNGWTDELKLVESLSSAISQGIEEKKIQLKRVNQKQKK